MMSQLKRILQTCPSRKSLDLAVDPHEDSGGRLTPTETGSVGRIILDLVPLEIDTVASTEGIGGRDRPKGFCRSSRLALDYQLTRFNEQETLQRYLHRLANGHGTCARLGCYTEQVLGGLCQRLTSSAYSVRLDRDSGYEKLSYNRPALLGIFISARFLNSRLFTHQVHG